MTSPHKNTPIDFERLLESIPDAFCMLDREWRFTCVNRNMERLVVRNRQDLLGSVIWDVFPEAVGSIFDQQYRHAALNQENVSFGAFYPPLSAWFSVRAIPSSEGLAVYIQDISARKETEIGQQRRLESLTAAAEALQFSQDQLKDAQSRLEAAMLAGDIATWTFDIVNDRVVADVNLARLFAVNAVDAAGGSLGAYLQAIHPDDRPRVIDAINQAIASQDQFESEYRVAQPDGSQHWLVARGKIERDNEGRALALPGVVVDITEQIERERRQQLLAELSERARRMTDPEEIIADAVRSIGQFLGLSRCAFADIDIEADTCSVPVDYCSDDSIASIVGVFPISAFGQHLLNEFQAGRTVAVDDVKTDPVRIAPENVGAYEAFSIRSYIAAPVVHSARTVSCLACHSAMPRHWKAEDVELVQLVVERTWLTIEVVRQQRALAREADERREAHQRTGRILESITDAFFALDSDWRFTYINGQAEELWERTREDLLGSNVWNEFPEAVGSAFDLNFRHAMVTGNSVSFEEFYAPLNTWLEVRAYPYDNGLSVFFQNVNERKEQEQALRESEERLRLATEGAGIGIWKLIPATNELTWSKRCSEIFGLPTDGSVEITGELAWSTVHSEDLRDVMAAIDRSVRENVPYFREFRVVHSNGDIRWIQSHGKPYRDQQGELMRVEGVLMDITPQREAADRLAMAYGKERNIASQLQSALQPELPGAIPGLGVAKYYEAALTDEAAVGGDFHDVFAIEKGCTALVVGDLSGKGLQAAAQVSIVRNMLRAFLYSKPTVAEAVNDLNRIVADNNLLTGFSTLFVGTYDGGTHSLNYVNCGQEPALIKRKATGAVEALMPTGPILGTVSNAQYIQTTVELASGDAIAIFTDGLTEVGPSRRDMLGNDGVAELLSGIALTGNARNATEEAETLLRSLVEGVNSAAAGGVMRDDTCLLVAIVD